MPATRRAFLGAAATAPAWSLPFGRTRLGHRWTYRSPELALPPRLGDGMLVTTQQTDVRNADRPSTVGLAPDTGTRVWSQPGRVDWEEQTVGQRFVVMNANAVAAVATATGRTDWRVSVSEQVDGVLTAAAWDAENRMAYATTEVGVLGLDGETGDRLWDAVGERMEYVGSTAETTVLTNGEVVRGVDPRTGSERWQRDVRQIPESLHGGLVLDVDADRVRAWDATTGSEAWTSEVADGRARVLGSTQDHVFLRLYPQSYAVDDQEGVAAVTYDGREAWRLPVQADTGTMLTDEAILVLGVPTESNDQGREVTVLDPVTGRVQWRDVVEYGYGLATSSNGVLRFPTDRGVVARSVANGTERWRYDPEGTPVYAVERGGRVYVGVRATPAAVDDQNGKRPVERFALHAVDPPRGPLAAAERWVRERGVLVAGLAGMGLLGVGALAANRVRSKRRVQGHVETIERTDAWTTAHVQNGNVRTEFRPSASGVESVFTAACGTWHARDDEEGVLELREWGADPRPWVETAAYETTLADTGNRERGLRAVSRAADVLADTDHPHGALRPTSIVFDESGEAFVRDLGFGAFTHAAWPDRTDAFTPPEGGEPTAAGDVYRLGALAYTVLAGQPPAGRLFGGEFDASVSDDLREVLGTALARDPNDRYESVRRFGEYFAWAAFAQERNW